MRDINSKVQGLRSLSPAATTGTREGVGVAMEGAQALMALVSVGAVTTLNDTDKLTLTVLGGPDATIGNATAVDADAYISPRTQSGADWARVLDASFADADVCLQVGVENKRNDAYMFAKLTHGGSPSAIVGVALIKGSLPLAPNQAAA